MILRTDLQVHMCVLQFKICGPYGHHKEKYDKTIEIILTKNSEEMIINWHTINQSIRDQLLTFLNHKLFTVSESHFHDGYHMTSSAFTLT